MTGYADLVTATFDEIVAADPYIHRSAVSMSMLGRCRRQAAYAITQGWPEQPEKSGPQAWLGGAIHKDLLPAMARALGGEYEVPLVLDWGPLQLSGTADLVLESAVTDLKTVSQFYYQTVSEKIPHGHRLQVTGYAAALGKKHCTLLYVNRSDGSRFAEHWETDEYWPDVEQWLTGVLEGPDSVPRDERGPGLSIICDSCPFAEQCWGPAEGTRKPQAVIADEYGVEAALQAYVAARDVEKAAKADREYWRDVLTGTAPAAYGDWNLSWSGGRSKEVTDVAAAEALIESMGLPVPKRTTTGSRSISVTPHRET